MGIAKRSIYTNWLAFEEHCQCRIALESPLLGYLIGYVYRTFDIFCEQRQSGNSFGEDAWSHVEARSRLHILFGMIGFVKPVLLQALFKKDERLIFKRFEKICLLSKQISMKTSLWDFSSL